MKNGQARKTRPQPRRAGDYPTTFSHFFRLSTDESV
ncbi:MAG: hypothetical protein QOI63_8, partial [Thermoplasmata archaeon]|nr:hypothetical protein [Thermoplasmata archaeon]